MKKSWVLFVSIIIVCLSVFFFIFSNNQVTVNFNNKSSTVPPFKEWSFHFSEPMDPTTFSRDHISIVNEKNEVVPARFTWNDNYTILYVKPPKNGYQANEQYEIDLSKQVKTAKGKSLPTSLSHTFTVIEHLPKVENKDHLTALLKERQQEIEYLVEEEKVATFEMAEDSSQEAKGELDVSTTNVQVAGIDEGDVIKTDGKYHYFVRDNDIIITSSKAKNSKVISQISEKEYSPFAVYLTNDLLISIGESYQPIRNNQKPLAKNKTNIYPYPENQTTVYIYDISNRNHPKKVRDFTVEGYYHSSRKKDDYLYLIANKQLFHIYQEGSIDSRPFIKDSVNSDTGKPIDYEQLYYFPDSKDDNFLLIAAIDLKNLQNEVHIESYLGSSDQLYMSKNHLYVSVNHYENIHAENRGSSDNSIVQSFTHSEINQFSIHEGNVSYHASTIVPGTLINQFAMDERNNTFRVATTIGDSWQENDKSTNNLYTFDTNMNPLGSLEGLAEGEYIYSVRFMDNVAYMVTFDQIDPLFVIDLSDPNKPFVLGELEIPGFSNYLHPLDDHHVIGFGQHTKLVKSDSSVEPFVQIDGLKISLFDVSDPKKPLEKDSEIIGRGGSYSELNHNHKALYQYPGKNIFGFPAALFETKQFRKGNISYEEEIFLFEGLLLYDISPEKGIVLTDSLTHQRENIDYPEWESEIRRAVSAGDILYTFSMNQMQVYDLQQKKTVKVVKFP